MSPPGFNWFTINISLQSGGPPFFTGYFSVDNGTHVINRFYDWANPEVNILAITGNDYGADWVFDGTNFTVNGTTIKSIPALDGTYSATEWMLWYESGGPTPLIQIYHKEALTVPGTTSSPMAQFTAGRQH